MNLYNLFRTILSLSVMGIIVALIIFIIKGILRNKLSTNWHYYIWILLIIRLLIPYAPKSSFSIYNLAPTASEKIYLYENSSSETLSFQNSDNIDLYSNNEAIESTYKPAVGIKYIFKIISLLWLSISAILFLYITIVNFIYLYKIKRKPICEDENIINIFGECKEKMNISTNIKIVYENNLNSPSVFGIFKPTLLISKDIISRLTEEEKRYVFYHELAHIKKKDILLNYIAIFLKAVHWFNPILWISFNKMSQDCEIACDAYVLSMLEQKEHKKYGSTIIKLLESISKPNWAAVSTGMANDKNSIKKRLKRITTFKKSSIKWYSVSIALIFLICLIGMTKGNLAEKTVPKINIVANVKYLTDDEYKEVGTYGIDNPSKDDFRKLDLEVELLNAKDVSDKVLMVPNIGEIQQLLTANRYWFGGCGDQNNEGEPFSISTRSIVIYYRGLDNEQFKEMLKPLKINLGWTTNKGEIVEKEYSLDEIITFEK